MTLDWTNLAVMAALIAAAWALSCAVLQRAVRRAAAQRQQATDRHLKEMATTIQSLQAQVDELSEARGFTEPLATEFDMEAAAETVDQQPPHPEDQEVSPDVMAVLAAAAAAFLGAKVRVLSARLLESPHRVVNAWSQQGRVFVQASHNLRSRL